MQVKKQERIEQLLQTGRMYGENHSPGNYLKGLLDFIENHVSPETVACEVGSFRGISSELFAIYVKTLYCVDYWTPYSWEYNENNIHQAESEFDEMRKNYENIVKIKSKSVEASQMFSDGFFDLVYIDADHAEEPFREDMQAWIPKVKTGGIISGHDHSFVGDYISDFSRDQEVKVFEDGSWFYIKK